jgi:hypothetical protein
MRLKLMEEITGTTTVEGLILRPGDVEMLIARRFSVILTATRPSNFSDKRSSSERVFLPNIFTMVTLKLMNPLRIHFLVDRLLLPQVIKHF